MAEDDGTQGTGAPDGMQSTPGNEGLGWRAQLPDDLKGNETFTAFKTVGEFAKTHLDLTGKVKDLQGKVAGSIPKLPENATEEEKDVYYASLGRPEAPDKYKLPELKLADGLSISEPLKAWFVNEAFKNGLSNAQAGKLFEGYNEMMSQLFTQEAAIKKEAAQKAEEKLKTEWPGDQYKTNLEITKRAFKKFAEADFDAWINETGVGNHPTLIKFFFKVGKAMGEDQSPSSNPAGGEEVRLGMKYKDMDKFKGG
jgi:hypothetical protein